MGWTSSTSSPFPSWWAPSSPPISSGDQHVGDDVDDQQVGDDVGDHHLDNDIDDDADDVDDNLLTIIMMTFKW